MLCRFETVHVAKATCVANADPPGRNVLAVVHILSELKLAPAEEALIEEIRLLGDYQLRCLLQG